MPVQFSEHPLFRFSVMATNACSIDARMFNCFVSASYQNTVYSAIKFRYHPLH
jgi:hypothetical protein